MRTALLWLLPGMAWAGNPADCETPARVSDIQAQTLQTTLAFATLDVEGFAKAYDASHAQLECVAEQLPQSTIVDFHRTEALGAFFEKDEERTRNAFQALLTVQADWKLPEQLGAPGGALDLVLQKAREKPPSLEVPVVVPDGITVMINGVEAASRPANIPSLLQVLDANGAVVWNTYVQAGEPLPDLESLAAGGGATDPPDDADDPPDDADDPPDDAGDPPDDADDPRDDGDEPQFVVETVKRKKVGFAIEAGTTLGLRLEYRPASKVVSSVGLRGAVKYWGVEGAGALLYIDFNAVDKLDFELALGSVATVGAPTGVFGANAQYSLGKGFYIQGGVIAGPQVVFLDAVVGYFF